MDPLSFDECESEWCWVSQSHDTHEQKEKPGHTAEKPDGQRGARMQPQTSQTKRYAQMEEAGLCAGNAKHGAGGGLENKSGSSLLHAKLMCFSMRHRFGRRKAPDI